MLLAQLWYGYTSVTDILLGGLLTCIQDNQGKYARITLDKGETFGPPKGVVVIVQFDFGHSIGLFSMTPSRRNKQSYYIFSIISDLSQPVRWVTSSYVFLARTLHGACVVQFWIGTILPAVY